MAARAATEPVRREGLATIEEACQFLNLSRSTLYHLMNAGRLSFVSIGRARRIPRSALSKFVKRLIADAK